MATISSAGIGSGLDVDTIVTKLMALEQKPLTTLQRRASALDSKISAFGSLKSQLATLSDAADKLAGAATWNAKAVSSSNTSAVAASVASGADATVSSFSIEVSQLARAQSVASAAVASGSGIGSGTLSIQLGRWDGAGPSPAFAASSTDAVTVSVAAGDSLATIASKINAAGAGVTATVLKDLSGDRLMLRSSATGEAAGFRVRASDDGTQTGGPGLSALAFDDPAAGSGMAANSIQYGQNAAATINGIAVSAASNTLAGTIPGLSLTLLQTTTAPVEITASTDAASMSSAVQSFVSAYNALNQMLNAATKYDATTKTGALLQGDATTVGLQNAIRTLVGQVSGGGALQRLSDLGVSIAKNGAGDLALDSTRLGTALKDPAAVQQFFAAAAGSSDSVTGFATRFSAFTRSTIGSEGSLSGKTTALQSQKTRNSKDQDRLNDRLTLVEQRLRKQYTSLDGTMNSLTALSSYVTQQIAQWNRSSGN